MRIVGYVYQQGRNDMNNFQSNVLKLLIERERTVGGVACVTVCHNEALIINNFLDHYRSIGIRIFYIVDDNSTDGTFEILKEQKDVFLFKPTEKSEFKTDLPLWRQEILDFFLDGCWVSLPDIDEFLYYKQMPKPLEEVSKEMDAKSEEILIGAMIDMYQDKPITRNKYSGERSLVEEFPFFDGQAEPPFGIRIISQQKKYLNRFPTPEMLIKGGVRDRLFFQDGKSSWFQRWLVKKFANSKRPLNPNFLQKIQNEIVRRATKNMYSFDPPVLNKFALIKWRRGLKFRRAPHCVNEKMRVSEGLAAFLHFKFYKGDEMINYNVQRGQHTGDSAYYKKMLEKRDKLEISPICSCSKEFKGISSLSDILR